jgi:electron transfer flavoprotein beta subunit
VTSLVVLVRRLRGGPDGAEAPRLLGACDQAALALALALRAARPGASLTALAFGPADREEVVLAHALAGGADRAVRVWDPAAGGLDYHGVAQILAAAARRIGFGLILGGDHSDDERAGAVGPAVAEHLGLPHLSAAVGVALDETAGEVALVTRRDGEKRRTFRVELPAVVTVVPGGPADVTVVPGGPADVTGVPGGPAAQLGEHPAPIETLDLDALGIHATELRPRQHCLGALVVTPASTPTLLGRADELLARLYHDRLLDP